MSVPSSAIAQMLMQGSGGAAPQGGGLAGNGMQTGADLIRKMMMIKALQAQQQQPGQPQQPVGVGGFQAPPGQVLPQAMNAQQNLGGSNA